MFEKLKKWKKGMIDGMALKLIYAGITIMVLFLLAPVIISLVNTSGNTLAQTTITNSSGSTITTGGASLLKQFGGEGIIITLLVLAILLGGLFLVFKMVGGKK